MTTDNRLFVYKYQPLYFDDFGKSNDVVKTLRSLLMIDYVNILLVGDVASGKTSILNSIIREYYYGYTPKEYEDNVLYINNLKEQGINYYRTDVKTFCQTCSVIKNKKKIIVLDDIDLINEQSQQVFRNCIDKYGHNVHFISSCSNIQKVIETLQSRLTIIKMLQLHREDLTNILNRIKKAEQIDIDNDAQEFVINISNNTIKILITYMEKFKLLNEKITMDLAVKLCSNISFCVFTNYINLCLENSLPKAIQLIYEIYDKGYSVMDILDNLFFFVKTTTMLSEDQKYTIIPYICKYITIFHNIHEDEIELALFTNNIINMLQ
ncbi:MAG: AAA family ATPase [Candidatus Marinimicrobia bacterium]|nr:AAA family ATPase [Candidatus Neomarinimicrobiota bacterium]